MKRSSWSEMARRRTGAMCVRPPDVEREDAHKRPAAGGDKPLEGLSPAAPWSTDHHHSAVSMSSDMLTYRT